MTILLKRNRNKDPWFTSHEGIIEDNEVVILAKIEREEGTSLKWPPVIYVERKISTGDRYRYIASLNCFDHVKRFSAIT